VLEEEHEMVKEAFSNAYKVKVELDNKPEFSQSTIDCLNTLRKEQLQRRGVSD